MPHPHGQPQDVYKRQALKEIKEVNRARLTEYKKYRPNSESHEGRGVWVVKADLALPCATQNELLLEDAKALVENGCTAVCEGANIDVYKRQSQDCSAQPSFPIR